MTSWGLQSITPPTEMREVSHDTTVDRKEGGLLLAPTNFSLALLSDVDRSSRSVPFTLQDLKEKESLSPSRKLAVPPVR